MRLAKLKLGLGLAASTLLAGCGAPGIPQPPSLELARPVRDLMAIRKANQVRLTWSVPIETTDHHRFRHAGVTQVCRNLGTAMAQCGSPIFQGATPVSGAKLQKAPRSRTRGRSQPATTAQGSYTDQLSPDLETESPTENLVYAVSVLNSYGKAAGLSNQVEVPSAPTLPAPSDFAAKLSAEGVRLTWNRVAPPQEISGIEYFYRVYRRDVENNKDSVAGEIPLAGESNPALVDKTFEWEKTYDYRVTVVTLVQRANGTEQVEGDDSAALRVVAHDVFPPRTPTGLQAVFSGPGQQPFIDLVWKANVEGDLAGYNVYRRQPGGRPAKLNTELVRAPAFRDAEVMAGQEYFYSVSAIDVRGNESPRSAEASETVPRQP
jgi:hypothetical protein